MVLPAPVPVRARITNISGLPKTIKHVRALVLSTDVLFDPSTPSEQIISQYLEPLEEVTVDWLLHVTPTRDPRDIQVIVRATDSEDVESECQHSIYVEPGKNDIICSVATSAPAFVFNKASSVYQPTNIAVTAAIRNIGALTLPSVDIRLDLSGSWPYVSLDSSLPGNTLMRTITDWEAGDENKVVWYIKIDSVNSTGVAKNVVAGIQFDDGVQGWVAAGCYANIEVGPEEYITEGLNCSISAPDTIRFTGTGYDPEVFDVGVTLRNAGTSSADNIMVTLLQGARFIVLGSSTHYADALGAGMVDSIPKAFRLQVTPHNVDRYDTIRVLTVSDLGGFVLCEYPVFIEAERMPELFIECVSDIDSIKFDITSGELVPDRVMVSTLIANTGTAPATNVIVAALTPPGYMLLDSALIYLPDLPPASTRNLNWELRPLCSTTTSFDTLGIQVRATGGYRQLLIVEHCSVPFVKEACDTNRMILECDMPATVTVINGATSYSPDPFMATVTVRNSTLYDSEETIAQITVLPPLSLAAGQASSLVVPPLNQGEEYVLSWELEPESILDTIDVDVCVELVNSTRKLAECCSPVQVVPYIQSKLDVRCSAPDTLFLEDGTLQYANLPVSFCATIINSGLYSEDSVELSITASPDLVVSGVLDTTLAGPVAPGGSFPEYCVFVEATPSYLERRRTITITARTSDGGVFSCVHEVVLLAADFEPPPCLITVLPADAVVSNRAGNQLLVQMQFSVANLLHVPLVVELAFFHDIELADGETAERIVDPGTMVGDTATLTWNVLCKPTYRDKTTMIETIVTQGDTLSFSCSKEIRIKGIKPQVSFEIPTDIFVSFGEQVTIPVIIDEADPVEIAEFSLRIEYDPEEIQYLGYSTEGTITGLGWIVTPVLDALNSGSFTLVAQSTEGGSVFTGGSPAINFVATTVNDHRRDDAEFFTTLLDIVDQADSTIPWISTMRSVVEGVDRDVEFTATDGVLYITGDCIVPLQAGKSFGVAARPNPFRNGTTISFSVNQSMHVRVYLYDIYGRRVRTMYSAQANKGTSVIRLNRGALNPGTYLCVVETDVGIAIEKVIILK